MDNSDTPGAWPECFHQVMSEYPWTAGSDFQLTWMHPAARHLYGCSVATLMGDPAHRLSYVHPEDRDRVEAKWKQAAELRFTASAKASSQPCIEFEYRILTKDGQTKWVSETIVPWGEDRPGDVGGLTRVMGDRHHLECDRQKDISTRGNQEHPLEFERSLLSTLLETVPESVYFKDAESRFIRMSRSCAAKLGVEDPSQALGKSDADFFSPQHACETLADEKEVMETGIPIRGKIEYQAHKDGREIYCSITKVPMVAPSGKVIGTFGISMDVTSQIANERELARERDLLRTIIDNVPDLIYVKDRAGRFITANASLLKLLGLNSPEQIKGKTDYDFSPAEMACQYVADDQNVMREQKPLIDREESHPTEKGEWLWLLTTKVPLFSESRENGNRENENREVVGVVGISHDITARKNANEKMRSAMDLAEKANRAKSDFLANMSHEIRTPMNAIIGMTELVLETQLEPSQRNFLSMVSESAEALLGVINDILDFSKIEAGKFDLDNRVFDVRESLGDTMKTLGVKAHSKGLELAFRVAPDVPRHVMGDVGRLRQVLINLVGNALKFTEAGEVAVDVLRVPTPVSSPEDVVTLQISVRDTGIGIPQEKLSKIFREFEQADTSTTRRFGGTGLGLTISSRIARLMGGEIHVQSVLNEGSCFEFEVQFGVAHQGSVEDADQHRRRGAVVVGGTRILVVDDNETNRLILAEILAGWGIVTTLASSGEEALIQLRQAAEQGEPFGLVISDVNMPHMSGYDFIQHVRDDKAIAETRVVVLTSGGRDGDRRLNQRLKVEERLMKPVKQSELFDSIIRSLGVNATEEDHANQAKQDTFEIPSLEILLAEDNLVNQKLAVGLLSRDGHEVTIAQDGNEVLDKLNERDFDVILMDVQMPNLDGLEATRTLRLLELNGGEEAKHIPIIAMTAHAMKGDREKCLEAGMDEYVAKPIRLRDLREKLSTVLSFSPVSSSESPENLPHDSATIDSATIDWDHANETVGGDQNLLADLLNIYRGEAKHLVRQMQSASQQAEKKEDRQMLLRLAHTLKGASLSVGALPTSRCAGELERNCESLSQEDLLKQVEQVDRSVKINHHYDRGIPFVVTASL